MKPDDVIDREIERLQSRRTDGALDTKKWNVLTGAIYALEWVQSERAEIPDGT